MTSFKIGLDILEESNTGIWKTSTNPNLSNIEESKCLISEPYLSWSFLKYFQRKSLLVRDKIYCRLDFAVSAYLQMAKVVVRRKAEMV